MKKSYIIVGVVLAMCLNYCASFSAHAIDTIRPSQSEFERSITPIRNLVKQSTPDQTSKFPDEYRYLEAIISVADDILADYDQTKPEKITELISAANDAYRGCQLIFNAESALANYHANQTASSTTTYATPENPKIEKAISTQPSQSKTASAANAVVTEVTDAPTEDLTTAQTPNAIPSTPSKNHTIDFNAEEANDPQLTPITLAQTTTLCLTAGAIVITNRDKIRRP